MCYCVCVCKRVCVCLYLWHTTVVPNRHSALAGGGCGVVCVSRTGFLVTSLTSVLWTSCISPKLRSQWTAVSRSGGEMPAWMSVSASITSRVGWAGVTFSKFSADLSFCTAKKKEAIYFLGILVTCTPAGVAVIFGSAWSLNSSSVIHSLSLERPPHL